MIGQVRPAGYGRYTYEDLHDNTSCNEPKSSLIRCRLEPVTATARTINKSLWVVLINAIILAVSFRSTERVNSRIKMIEVRTFRNKQRFAPAIYLHFGGLDVYSEDARK